MKTKSSGKALVDGSKLADGWIAVQVTPRAEEAVFGTFRSTRKEARHALSLLLCREIRKGTEDLTAFVDAKVAVDAQIWAGTYEDIRIGCRHFRIVKTRVCWWAAWEK